MPLAFPAPTKNEAQWDSIEKDISSVISSEAEQGGIFNFIKDTLSVIQKKYSEKIGAEYQDLMDKAEYTEDAFEMENLYQEHANKRFVDMLFPSVPEYLAKNENIPYSLLEKIVEDGKTLDVLPFDLILHKDTPKEVMDEFCKNAVPFALEAVLVTEKKLPLSSIDHMRDNRGIDSAYYPTLDAMANEGIHEMREKSISRKEIDEILGIAEEGSLEGTVSEKIAAVLSENATINQFQSLYRDLEKQSPKQEKYLIYKILGAIIEKPENPLDKLMSFAEGTPANRYLIDIKDQKALVEAQSQNKETSEEEFLSLSTRKR